jgi:hypothetical protein
MPTFMVSMNFTDQGIRTIKDALKRTQAARDLAKKLGIEIKHIYLVAFVEAPMGDNIAKFALALGSADPHWSRMDGDRIHEDCLRVALNGVAAAADTRFLPIPKNNH